MVSTTSDGPPNCRRGQGQRVVPEYYVNPAYRIAPSAELHALQQAQRDALQRIQTPPSTPDLRPTYSTGQISGVKALFAISKLLCSCCVEYNVKKPSDKDAEAVVTPQSQIESFAIVCYNHPVGERWRLECIGINNEDLRDALFLLFEDYPGVDCSSEELSFTQPFVPFLHLWSRFVELVESVTEPVLRENLEILQHILKKQLKEAFKADEILQETGCVNFDHVPIAFTPGEVVLTKRDGVMSAALLKEIERVTSDDEKDVCYGFKVNQLDWDGLNCGVRESTFKIAEFEGDVPLGDLDIVPLKSHPRPEVIKERLIGRGRKFERLRREQHMIYNAHGREMIVHNTMMKVNERVIIDAKAFYEDARNLRAMLKPLSELKPENAIRKPIIPTKATFRELVESPKVFCLGQGRPYTSEKRGAPDYSPLTDEQCLLAVPTVFGFGLDTKKWFKLSVSNLMEISWNSDAMDKLIINESDKDLVLSHVCAAPTPRFGEEKGKGSMILLAGPPGTGKTFTAETASEEVKRPLYKLSVSDLGTNAADIESSLTRVLRRCAKWNMILSIDEADVFLEARSPHSPERNKIVSVFLRRLEYYSGAMILTANRYFTVDTAFDPHINLALPFKEPDAAARAKIWRNFINRSVAASALTDGDLAPLAKVPLNGRHIQGAFKTACVLAARRRVPLNIEHLQTVIEARHRAARLLGGGGV